MTRVLFAASMFGLLVACSPGAKNELSDSSLAPEDDSFSGRDDTGAADTAHLELRWMGLSGSATVADGALSAFTVEFSLYVDPPGEAPDCVTQRAAELGELLASSPDASVFQWWRLPLAVADGEDACLAELPEELLFGLGAMHPEIAPALEEHGLSGVSGSLYGAYANPYGDAGTAYVFGFAGTDMDRAGDDAAVAMGPMPNGDYSFTGFYLFGLP